MTALFALLSAGRTGQRSLVQQIRPLLGFLVFLPSLLLAGIASLGCRVEFSPGCCVLGSALWYLVCLKFCPKPKFVLQNQLQYVLYHRVAECLGLEGSHEDHRVPTPAPA